MACSLSLTLRTICLRIFPVLMQINLKNIASFITDETIEALALYRRDALTRVVLERCSKVSDSAIMVLAEQCPYLRRLNLSQCPEISDTSVRAVMEACDELELLLVTGCTKVSDEVKEQLAAREVVYELTSMDDVIAGGSGGNIAGGSNVGKLLNRRTTAPSEQVWVQTHRSSTAARVEVAAEEAAEAAAEALEVVAAKESVGEGATSTEIDAAEAAVAKSEAIAFAKSDMEEGEQVILTEQKEMDAAVPHLLLANTKVMV